MEKTLITLTRDRKITVWEGEDIWIRKQECENCNSTYTTQAMVIKYCPKCGVKYENYEDASV